MDTGVRQQDLEGFTAVFTFGHHGVEVIDPVLVFGVHINFVVVERAVAHFVAFAHLGPGCPTVVGAVQAIFLSFHEGVGHVGFGARDGEAGAAQVPGGQSVFFRAFHPGISAVMGHVDPRPSAPGGKEPGLAAIFPECGDQFFGVGGVGDQVGTACAIVGVQDFIPGFSPVFCAVDAAFRVRAEGGALGTCEDHIGVIAAHDNTVDGLGLFQAHVLPGFATIQAAVDTGACILGVARVTFARPDPDIAGVVLIDSDGADRLHGLVVEDRLPLDAPARRFPDPARSGTGIDDIGVAQVHVNRGDASAHTGGADIPRFDAFEPLRIECLGIQYKGQGR